MPNTIFGQLLKKIGRLRAILLSVVLDSASHVVHVSEVHVLSQSWEKEKGSYAKERNTNSTALVKNGNRNVWQAFIYN